jgi:hypothetical protein
MIVALLLVLASLGVAYGLWSQTLTIHGTVHTGEVDAVWSSCECIDRGLDPSLLPSPPIPKDVGSTTCTIDAQNPHVLHLAVENGYPSYWNSCEVHIRNAGTIPVNISGYRVVPINFTRASAYGAGDGELWVRYWDGQGVQMDPCPDESCEQASSLQFHVEQAARENFLYEFEILVCVAQWNEGASLDQCLAASP